MCCCYAKQRTDLLQRTARHRKQKIYIDGISVRQFGPKNKTIERQNPRYQGFAHEQTIILSKPINLGWNIVNDSRLLDTRPRRRQLAYISSIIIIIGSPVIAIYITGSLLSKHALQFVFGILDGKREQLVNIICLSQDSPIMKICSFGRPFAVH